MSDIGREQDALVTFEVTRWLSAHCSDHERFDASCPACQSVPQCCPEHPPVNGGFPGFDLGCEACFRTRPGSDVVGVVHQQVMTAEGACIALGIPRQLRRGGKVLRIPLNLLKKNSVSTQMTRT